MRFKPLLAALAAFPMMLAAQGEVTLRTGLVYAPDPLRTVAVLPVRGGPYADSLLEIVQRDLQYSDRVSVLRLNASDNALFYDKFRGVSYDYFAGLNATYVVEMTAAQGRVSMRVHDIGRRRVTTTADFALPATGLSRDWRMAVHSASDSAVAILTEGPRGVAATRIAYVRGQTLRMVDSDGANDVQIPADSNATSPSWDPTGRRIVYNTYGSNARIIMTDLAGNDRIIQPKIRNVSPTTPIFTRDGTAVIYARSDDDSYSTLWRVPLTGGSPLLIDRGRGISSSPSLSPDGRRIAFMTDRIGHNEVYIIDADGTNPVWITQIAGDLNESSYRGEPDWSPDGVTVALQSRVSGSFQIMTVNMRDNVATLLTSEGENQSPAWAPDGRHILYTSNRSGSDQLWIKDTRSGVTRQLTNQSGAKYGAWSPRLGVRQ
jgi:tol-pal system beta propeller repeat protein TolB